MATIRKRGQAWRAELYKAGVRESATFRTKREAAAWALARESELIGRRSPDKTLADALERYAREVSPQHRGCRWEQFRCRAIARLPIAKKRIIDITASDIAERRDERLKTVKPNTVRREMTLLSSMFNVALREWGWIAASPMAGVTKPTAPAGRRRRITGDEVERIQLALGYEGGAPSSASDRVALAFLFALETAMRAGEITGLTWDRVHDKHVALPVTKNGDRREVPLSKAARNIISLLPRTAETVFDLDPGTRDSLFRRARDNAQISDLHFHDTRAEAIWRMSKKLDVMELARVIGHRDLKSLLIYYQASASDLADRLD